MNMNVCHSDRKAIIINAQFQNLLSVGLSKTCSTVVVVWSWALALGSCLGSKGNFVTGFNDG